MSYKETENNIKNLENKYGELAVRSAFTYMIDVGKEHFNNDTVNKIKENIKADCREIEARGNVPLATAEFQCGIVDVAYELSKLPTLELFVYIQENMYIDVGQETISKSRMNILLGNCLDYINQDMEYDPIRFVEETMDCLGINEEELETLGYGDAVKKYEYAENEPEIIMTFTTSDKDEINILYKVLNCLKIGDIDLYYDKNNLLVAKDDWDNEWHGKEFYEFLIDEAFVYDDNSVLGIDDELLMDFNKHANKYNLFAGKKLENHNLNNEPEITDDM